MSSPAWKLTVPTTAKSRRRIALTARAIEALRRHRARQAQEQLALGEAWADYGFLVCRQDGEPLCGTHVLERGFHPLLQHGRQRRSRLCRCSEAAILSLLRFVPIAIDPSIPHSATIAAT